MRYYEWDLYENPLTMNNQNILLAMTIAGVLALAGETQGNIIYNVNEVVGAGGVVGSITTGMARWSSQRRRHRRLESYRDRDWRGGL